MLIMASQRNISSEQSLKLRLLEKDSGKSDLPPVAKMISIESLLRREVYDECYVVFYDVCD